MFSTYTSFIGTGLSDEQSNINRQDFAAPQANTVVQTGTLDSSYNQPDAYQVVQSVPVLTAAHEKLRAGFNLLVKNQ